MFDFLRNLFNTHGFPPRWQCGVWSTGHGWLHIGSDFAIWGAYYAIPLILIYFVYRRRDVPFRGIFLLFGAFILACGTTHLMDAIMFWWPAYRLSGVIKLTTAIVSWAAVIALIPIVPQALSLRSPKAMEEEVKRRTAELAHANQSLVQSEERWQLAMAAGRMVSWDWEVATGRVISSHGWEDLHGIPAGTFSGTFEAYQNDIHVDDREAVVRSIRLAVEDAMEHHVEYRVVWPNGSIHWIEARGKVLRDDFGKPIRMIGIFMDIQERKQSEQLLRFQADASRSLANLVDYQSTMQRVVGLAVPHFADGCAAHIADDDGHLRQLATTHLDPAKTELIEEFGKRIKVDAVHKIGPAQVFKSGRSELVAKISEITAEDEANLRDLRELRLKSYMCVPLSVREKILGTLTFIAADSRGHFGAADLAVAEDLGHRAAVAIENAQLYAQARENDRRKDEFLAMLAHELRNPLAPIRSGLDLLGMQGSNETVEIMQEQVRHLVRLVDDLLDVSRIIRGKIQVRKEIVRLSDILERSIDAARPLFESQRHELTVSLPPAPVWLNADPVRVGQIVTNLLNNAAKYTQQGGHIWLSANQEDGQAVIVVRDNGIGIDKTLLPRIFDLFTQGHRTLDRSQGGLGIGLTLVKSLTEMHGGTVDAFSEGIGKGSTFKIRLPASRQPIEQDVHGTSPELNTARRILIVEDNVAAAKLLVRLLKAIGNHEVQVAYDGETGLGVAKSFQPEVVLLDIGLPGIDGYEVAKRLRKLPHGDRPLLAAVSGYGQEEDRRRSMAAGFDEHLLKPVGLDVVQSLFHHPKLVHK